MDDLFGSVMSGAGGAAGANPYAAVANAGLQSLNGGTSSADGKTGDIIGGAFTTNNPVNFGGSNTQWLAIGAVAIAAVWFFGRR